MLALPQSLFTNPQSLLLQLTYDLKSLKIEAEDFHVRT